MEDFEQSAIEGIIQKLALWLCYIDDDFVIWKRWEQGLLEFFEYLKSRHPNIRFTMEKEALGSLPFLDVFYLKKGNGFLEFDMHRKEKLYQVLVHYFEQKSDLIKMLFLKRR